MAMHLLVTFYGKSNHSTSVSYAAKAIIEISKDHTWSLKTTPGGAGWWIKGAEWYSGTWSLEDSNAVFYNSNYSFLFDKSIFEVFRLSGFNYPAFINSSGRFSAPWASSLIDPPSIWQAILTDELLREAVEEFNRIQQEIIEIGVQAGLDSLSILDESGVMSLAAAGYALSRGAYAESALCLGTAIPFLGKFTAGAAKVSADAKLVADNLRILKEIEEALNATKIAQNEVKLSSVVTAEKLIVVDINLTKPLEEVVKVNKIVKEAKKLRDSGGQVPKHSKLVNQSKVLRGGSHYYEIPQIVADRLAGSSYTSFGGLRNAFWKQIAADETLAREFAYDARNLAEMKKGNAPFVKLEQQAVLTKKGREYKNFRSGSGKDQGAVLQKYVLHHKQPIAQKGAVYDLANISIITPRYHQDILEKTYHFKLSNPK